MPDNKDPTCASGNTGRLRDSLPMRAVVDRIVERTRTAPPRDDDKIAEAERNQRAAAAVRLLAEDLGARYGPARVSLENYAVYDARQQDALALLNTFLGELAARVESGSGLIFY